MYTSTFMMCRVPVKRVIPQRTRKLRVDRTSKETIVVIDDGRMVQYRRKQEQFSIMIVAYD